jgi:hypothetical protein
MVNPRVLFGLLILTAVFLLPASHSVLGQEITEPTPSPDWPTDAVTVFLPLIVKPSTSPPLPPQARLHQSHFGRSVLTIPERYITAQKPAHALLDVLYRTSGCADTWPSKQIPLHVEGITST